MKIPCAYKNEALTVKAVANSFFVFTVALWQTFENLDKARSKHFISYGFNIVFLLIFRMSIWKLNYEHCCSNVNLVHISFVYYKTPNWSVYLKTYECKSSAGRGMTTDTQSLVNYSFFFHSTNSTALNCFLYFQLNDSLRYLLAV